MTESKKEEPTTRSSSSSPVSSRPPVKPSKDVVGRFLEAFDQKDFEKRLREVLKRDGLDTDEALANAGNLTRIDNAFREVLHADGLSIVNIARVVLKAQEDEGNG